MSPFFGRREPLVYVFSEYVCRDANSTGYYWQSLIGVLNEKCNGVIVVSTSDQNKNEMYDHGGLKFISLGASSDSNLTKLSRLIGKIRLSFMMLFVLVRHVKAGDVVLSGTNPAPFVVVCAFFIKLKRFKWLLQVHDVFPENLVPAKLVREGDIRYKFAKWVFDWAYKKPNKTVVVGRDMADLIYAKTGRQENIEIIQNWVITNEIHPENKKKSSIIKELGWEDRMVFLFFGNIGPLQGLDNLLNAINLLGDSNQRAFLFAGGGSSLRYLEDYISKSSGKNIAYIGSIPLNKNEEILNSCDVAIVSLATGMLGLGVPSKAYFSLAANKPLLVVGDPDSELARLLDEAPIGWFSPAGDPFALSKEITQIGIEELEIIANLPRQTYLNNFTSDIALHKYIKLIEQLKSTHQSQKQSTY